MWIYTMFVTFTISMIIGTVICINQKHTDEVGGFITAVIVLFIASQLMLYIDANDKGYKQGQIDAMTNKVKYELITHPDSTKVWREKEIK